MGVREGKGRALEKKVWDFMREGKIGLFCGRDGGFKGVYRSLLWGSGALLREAKMGPFRGRDGGS